MDTAASESTRLPPGGKITSPRPHSLRRPVRWLASFATVVLLATLLPYLVGFACQGSTWRFSGFVFGVEDGNSYLAKMLGGTYGAWLFHTPYTTVEQQGVLAFLPYVLLGKLAAPPGLHEQLAALYQLFRLGAGMLAIVATYDFIAHFTPLPALRYWGLTLAVLGGGLGWVLVLVGRSDWLGSLPLDFYSPESFGFLGILGLPHLSLARAALLWTLLGYLQRLELDEPLNWKAGLKSGAMWLLACLAQPLAGVVIGGVIGLHLLALAAWLWLRRRQENGNGWNRWRRALLQAGLAAALPVPFLLYNFLAFRLDPFLKAWTGQNLILSPHPLHYLLAYGLVLPFAITGGVRLLRRRCWSGLLPVAWVLSLPALAYAPFNLQRRLPEGIWVGLCVLALQAFTNPVGGSGEKAQPDVDPEPGLARSSTNRVPRRMVALTFLSLPSTVFLLVGGLLAAVKPAQPVFRLDAEIEAFNYLQKTIQPGEVVLASFETGNALPAWVPARVVIGHGPESAGLAALGPQVEAFYRAETTDEARLRLLQDQQVRYVFWGPAERGLGSWNPSQAQYLSRVYADGDYAIFQLRLRK